MGGPPPLPPAWAVRCHSAPGVHPAAPAVISPRPSVPLEDAPGSHTAHPCLMGKNWSFGLRLHEYATELFPPDDIRTSYPLFQLPDVSWPYLIL